MHPYLFQSTKHRIIKHSTIRFIQVCAVVVVVINLLSVKQMRIENNKHSYNSEPSDGIEDWMRFIDEKKSNLKLPKQCEDCLAKNYSFMKFTFFFLSKFDQKKFQEFFFSRFLFFLAFMVEVRRTQMKLYEISIFPTFSPPENTIICVNWARNNGKHQFFEQSSPNHICTKTHTPHTHKLHQRNGPLEKCKSCYAVNAYTTKHTNKSNNSTPQKTPVHQCNVMALHIMCGYVPNAHNNMVYIVLHKCCNVVGFLFRLLRMAPMWYVEKNVDFAHR